MFFIQYFIKLQIYFEPAIIMFLFHKETNISILAFTFRILSNQYLVLYFIFLVVKNFSVYNCFLY